MILALLLAAQPTHSRLLISRVPSVAQRRRCVDGHNDLAWKSARIARQEALDLAAARALRLRPTSSA